jgi:hypothetical protein
METKEFSVSEQGISLKALAVLAGEDLCVILTGGELPHIGSVSVGIPRPSLRDSSAASATVSTFNFIAHKDGIVGDRLAHRLAAALNKNVVVTCGIHMDNICPQGIGTVEKLAEQLTRDMLQGLQPKG